MCGREKKCPICCSRTIKSLFSAVIRNKYKAVYSFCEQCRFLFIKTPNWLSEAYKEPINISDTGLLARNIALSKVTSTLIYFFFNKKGKFLDYAGGYGILTRLMRDIGFDFYWHDPYSTNLMARGFEFTEENVTFELITCFEVLEHLENPLEEIEKMFNFSDNILFSTTLLPPDLPKISEWSYYGTEHGQHISFYSLTTLQIIAKRLDCNLYSNKANIHLFTKRILNPYIFRVLLILSRIGAGTYVKMRIKSKTQEDNKSILLSQSRKMF